MSDLNRLKSLLTSLGAEILTARGGSPEGQFPILDLLENLRTEARDDPGLKDLFAHANSAWERMAEIVEGGAPFSPAQVEWLRELLGKLQGAAEPRTAAQPGDAAGTSAFVPAVGKRPETNPPEENESRLVLNLPEDEDMLREFCAESREHLDNIEHGVLVLESKPDDSETLNTVFRAFHTFKGSAGFLNLVPINRLAHVMESLLDLARRHKLTIDRGVIDLILRGRDTLKLFLDQIEEQLAGREGFQPVEIPTADLKGEVQAMIDSVPAEGEGPAPSAAKPARGPSGCGASAKEPANKSAGGEREVGASTAPVAGESQGASPTAQAPSDGAGAARVEHSAVVKVDTGKLDALLDLVGEMVISQSLVSGDLGGIAKLNPRFAANMTQLSRITKELQRVSMSMRMVPIRGTYQKMVRVVRDIGAKQGKRVQLVTKGEDTELDRGVVEQLNDPLLHLIRNSMDHGIETEEVRLAKGKPPVGTICLSAYHQGGNIVIEVSDDGAGLDRDRILAKAVERGLVRPGAQPSDQEVFEFIFSAGFSTAAKVTDISGRGVGLDVVRRNLEILRGRVEISSVRGNGAQFKLSLPLTLAIIDGLVVGVGNEQYIIPTVSVLESIRLNAGMITSVAGRGEVVNVRGRLIPLLRLYDHFGIKPVSTDPADGIGVVVQASSSARCLLVDSLVAKQEVVIKNLNDLMAHKNTYLAGAAILGDGRVGLILDINALVHPDSQVYAKSA